MSKFSENVDKWFNDNWPEIGIDNIDNLPLDKLKVLKDEVVAARQQLKCTEDSVKQLGNSAYGACANPGFYFFNQALAGDITGECRVLTKFMVDKGNEFFHEEIWQRKDLWEKYDIDLDESKHNWLKDKPIWIYSDTDSCYYQYGDFFKCMTEDWHKRYPNPKDKIMWMVKFNQEFMDNQNNIWISEMYEKRHAKSTHSFETELISLSEINLQKKKYMKNVIWEKGKLYDHPKTKGTGIELIKSTTPPLCKEILTKLINFLIYEYSEMGHQEFVYFLADKLHEFKKQFYAAPIDDISQSIGVNGYQKYVINDETALEFRPHATPGVKGCARYNYLAHKAGADDKRIYSGKMKYYNIRISPKATDFFAYPFGECPEWAPKIDLLTQWEKTIITPINRFLEVMKIPQATTGGIEIGLFSDEDFK